MKNLQTFDDFLNEAGIVKEATDYPDTIVVKPQDSSHPLKSLTLKKTRQKFKSSDKAKDKTPVYITIKPSGMDDRYYVWDIDFRNKTVNAL